jgi:hypothetical protein
MPTTIAKKSAEGSCIIFLFVRFAFLFGYSSIGALRQITKLRRHVRRFPRVRALSPQRSSNARRVTFTPRISILIDLFIQHRVGTGFRPHPSPRLQPQIDASSTGAPTTYDDAA